MRIDSYDKKLNIVIWGTGHYFKCIMEYLDDMKNVVDGFSYTIDTIIDSDVCKQGQICQGTTIQTPSYVDRLDKKSLIIIAMQNDCDVERTLCEKGFTNILTTSDILCKEKLFTYYWDNFSTSINEKSPFVQRVKARKLLRNSIDNYIHINPSSNIYLLSAAIAEYGKDIDNLDFNYLFEDRPKDVSGGSNKLGIYYSRLFNGGVERVISQLLPKFIGAGYEIVLFTHEISELDYPIPKSVERCVIPFDPLMPYVWLEQFFYELKARRISVFINNAHASYRSYYLGICVKLLGIRYIVESHTCSAAIEKKGVSFFKKNYSIADELVVLSNRDKNYWLDKGISATYIPNPIDDKNVIYNKVYNEKEILWLGRIDIIEKNVYDIVPIAKKVVEVIPDARFKIVGRADDISVLKELEKKIKLNVLENNIQFCGYSDNVGEYFSKAAVYFMTSPYEGFPMTLVESKIFGVPTVMYEIDGLELTQDNMGVIKVQQGNSSKLAEGIISILQDRKLRAKLSKEARYSIEKFSSLDLMSLWKQVIKDDLC